VRRVVGPGPGVVVPPSHNPPRDNGYKVYLGDGSQIVPPADAGIADRIAAVGALAGVPRGSGGEVLGDDVLDRYLDVVAGLVCDGPRALTMVYTPLHGVGGSTVVTALERAGFASPHVAVAPAEPDPDLPPVAFPQPAGPG